MLGQTRVMRKIILRPDSELYSAGQIEEGHCTMLEFATDNAFGRQTKAVAIKYEGLFEISHAQRHNRNPRLHVHTFAIGVRTAQTP